MLILDIILQGADVQSGDTSRFHPGAVPVEQFRWWIVLCLLAFHGVLAAIMTELMGRTYGKWLLWFVIAFFLPFIGPISIYLYHLVLSTSVGDARKASLWDRMLMTGPVSLQRIMIKERYTSEEITLRPVYKATNRLHAGDRDKEIEGMIAGGKLIEARAHAWKMMEIAIQMKDENKIKSYQDYLEVVADKMSEASGMDAGSLSGK